jgi:ABC-type multidrug transport system ATPase subunit
MGGTVAGVGVTAQGLGIEGPSGSGRTCLLLALTGRMKATEGAAEVGGTVLPKHMAAVRRVSALAHVPGVTDLEPALTVAEHLHERALLQRRFGDSLRGLLRPRTDRRGEERLRIDAALTAAGLDLDSLPKGARTAVRDLERTEALRLSIALALIGRPRLLGVDDTDLKLADAERAGIWALLRSITETGTTVVAVCSESPDGAVPVSTSPVSTSPVSASPVSTSQESASPVSTSQVSTSEESGQPSASRETDGKEAADALAEAGRA